MQFKILGPVEAIADGVSVALGGPKSRTVLAALLLARGQVVRDDRLGYLLWRDDPPTTADAQIYTYVSRLRKVCGEHVTIVRRGRGYVLDRGSASFDHQAFVELAQAGRTALQVGDHRVASRRLAAALRLWTGPALVDVTEHLVDAELATLEEQRVSALENRIEADIALGHQAGVVSELVGLVARHPLRERFRAQLMYSLQACGRRAEALAVYEDGRRVLADELGVDPDVRTQETYFDILRDDVVAPRGVAVAGGAGR